MIRVSAILLVGVAGVAAWAVIPSHASEVRGDFLVIAHRGASSCAPMNTMAAYRKAVELGADGIETDVTFTADDVPVIAHPTLARLSGQQIDVPKMTFSETRRIDAGSWFSPRFKGEPVPTLDQALGYFATTDLRRIYLHDKRENDYANPERVRIFAQAIRNSGLQDRIVVMVEDGKIDRWQKHAPDIAIMQNWTGREWQKTRFPLSQTKAAGLKHFGVYDGPEQYDRWTQALPHKLSAKLGFWPGRDVVGADDFTVFTINEPWLMKKYLDAGFKAIGTDDVRLLQQVANGGDPAAGIC